MRLENGEGRDAGWRWKGVEGNRRECQKSSNCFQRIKPIQPYLTRFIRWLFKAEGILLQEPSDAWNLLAAMGRGAVRGCNAAGIRCYEEAEAACVYMRGLGAASGATYAVDDLVCLLCSTMHSEAALTVSLPPAATPVSIELDLGALPPASLPKSPRILTRSQPLTRILA